MFLGASSLFSLDCFGLDVTIVGKVVGSTLMQLPCWVFGVKHCWTVGANSEDGRADQTELAGDAQAVHAEGVNSAQRVRTLDTGSTRMTYTTGRLTTNFLCNFSWTIPAVKLYLLDINWRRKDRYSPASTVAMLKERIVAEWPNG
ncbi:hypothetical protein Tsubulata_050956 [Turnera subulata]|uniref:Uncharacterized protein n=1 Tax=Turnera subulata TaxID=218843 RepID=A0A9Q0FVQ7_9ROSI|nr:hypothetical protein Tsubulata_050956 [Turnera subulata]